MKPNVFSNSDQRYTNTSLARGDSSDPALHYNHHRCLSQHLFSVEIPVSETYPWHLDIYRRDLAVKPSVRHCRASAGGLVMWKLRCNYWVLLSNFSSCTNAANTCMERSGVRSCDQTLIPVRANTSLTPTFLKTTFKWKCLEKRCTLTLHVKNTQLVCTPSYTDFLEAAK